MRFVSDQLCEPSVIQSLNPPKKDKRIQTRSVTTVICEDIIKGKASGEVPSTLTNDETMETKSLPGYCFRCYVTLFPKYFSSFVRTTCALSVSIRYSALAEIHLPINSAISNRVTLTAYQRCSKEGSMLTERGFHSLWRHIPENFKHALSGCRSQFVLQFGVVLHQLRFKLELHPSSLAATNGITVVFFSSAY